MGRNIWNTIGDIVTTLTDEEQKKRMQATGGDQPFDPTKPMDLGPNGTRLDPTGPYQPNQPSTPVDNATQDSMGSHPGLRRLASVGGFSGSSNSGPAPSTLAPVADDLGNSLPVNPADAGSAQPAPVQMGAAAQPAEQYVGDVAAQQPVLDPTAAMSPVNQPGTVPPARRSDISGAALRSALDTESQDVAAGTERAKRRSKLSRFFRGVGTGLLNELESNDPHANWLGAIAQGVDEAVSPEARSQRLENARLQKLWMPYQRDAAIDKTDADLAYRNAQTESAVQKPINDAARINEKADASMRSSLTRTYNGLREFHDDADHPDDQSFADQYQKSYGFRPLDKTAKTKSEHVADESTGQQYLIQTDEAGHQKVLKLLNEDGTPMVLKDKAMLTSEDRAKQRDLQKLIADNRNVTSVKTAEIGARSRQAVADTNQAGAMARMGMSNSRQAAATLAAIPQRMKKIAGESSEDFNKRVKQTQADYVNSLPSEIQKQLNFQP